MKHTLWFSVIVIIISTCGNGQFGIHVKDGIDHQVWENIASNNTKGNIKIQGLTIPPPGSAPIGQRIIRPGHFFVSPRDVSPSVLRDPAGY